MREREREQVEIALGGIRRRERDMRAEGTRRR